MKRNDIESEDGALNHKSKSSKILKEINSKIVELEKLNPNYKVMLWKIRPDEWNYDRYESNTRIILKDTY